MGERELFCDLIWEERWEDKNIYIKDGLININKNILIFINYLVYLNPLMKHNELMKILTVILFILDKYIDDFNFDEIKLLELNKKDLCQVFNLNHVEEVYKTIL